MELRQLQYFLMVAQEQSFAKAAKKTYVSQQALSKSVLSLEQELGVPLFERLPHGVELTEYGQTLLKKAYRITNSVNEAVSEIHNMKDNVGRTIQLAITTGVEDTFQVKDLLRFQVFGPEHGAEARLCSYIVIGGGDAGVAHQILTCGADDDTFDLVAVDLLQLGLGGVDQHSPQGLS